MATKPEHPIQPTDIAVAVPSKVAAPVGKTAAKKTPSTQSKGHGASKPASAAPRSASVAKSGPRKAAPVKSAAKTVPKQPADVAASGQTDDPIRTSMPTPPYPVSMSAVPVAADVEAADAVENRPIAPRIGGREALSDPSAYPEETGLTASISQDPGDMADSDDALTEPLAVTPDAQADEPTDTDVDLDALRIRLTALQQAVSAAKIPVVIVFEGWNASGKGTMVSKLIEGLDPRGYQVYPIRKPTAEEQAYPTMRRYLTKMPEKGDISVFCGSWYREVSNACFESKAARKCLNQRYDEIVSLESQLVCDGALIIKFFLHIPRKEQKARLRDLESRKSTRWRVEKEDWEQNERYEEYLRLYDAMIARTHFEGALWHALRSDNKRACVQQIYETVLTEFEAALRQRQDAHPAWDTPYLPHLESMTTLSMPALDAFDPEQALTDPYKPAIDKAQKQLSKLQSELYRRGIGMAIGFEGWDAAGKGGAIRRLTSALDARGFDVVPIAAPTPTEKGHHHLWRFWNALPHDGYITVFDRTWYGRVMVERIEGFCTEPQWKRAYEEINRFEAEIIAHGTILVKFWMHIDSETQLTRFNDRQASPDKQWKITAEDWRNREKWPQYAAAVEEMLQKTNTATARWTVVEANNKQFARLKVLHTVIQAIEARLEADRD